MTTRSAIQTLILAAALLLTAAATCTATNRPVDIGTGYRIDSAGLHLSLPSSFLDNIHSDRILFAKTRVYREGHDKAIARSDYAGALSYCDSLIRDLKNHTIRGAKFIEVYRARALMLHAMQRDAEACEAYLRVLAMQDSIMYHQQNDAVSEMQTAYELDRLALDKALLRKHHHYTALISLVLLFLAILAVVAVLFRSNRRTKLLQRELLQKVEQAHGSEKQKTDFINSMCHEVRTPLNCLTGFSELFCSGEITPEMYAQYHDIVRTSRQQLRYILEDMLEVTYLENLVEPLPKEHIDLCALCRAQIRTIRVKYPRSAVACMAEIPNYDLGLKTNEKYLTTLLGELMDNAHKFTPEGTIRLACGTTGLNKAYITVTDTGCGILAEEQKRVFERFVKLDTFTQGNGLGLYLCTLIVRHLSGEIHIDPEYTEGTRVVVTLPRK